MESRFIFDKSMSLADGKTLVLDFLNGAVLAFKALIERIQRISHQPPVHILACPGIQEYQPDIPVLHRQHQPVRHTLDPAFQFFGGNILGQLGSIILCKRMQPDHIVIGQAG
ncbi:hypothetical protein D3C75_750190 [compost metagenome]